MAFITTLLKYEFAEEAAKHPLEKYQENHEGIDFEDAFNMCKGVNMKAPQYFNKNLEINSMEKEMEESRLAEVLNYLFPPRTYQDNGKDWIQYISKYLSNSMDLKHLEDELERMLLVRNARKKGLCVIRRQIYDQLFNELIRQVTIECIDRGLLLNRMKKDFIHLFYTYETMIKSSEAFLARKILDAHYKYLDRLKKINELSYEKRSLERQVNDLKIRVDQIDKRNQEMLKKLELKNWEQVNFFKLQIQQYKAYIDAELTGAHAIGPG